MKTVFELLADGFNIIANEVDQDNALDDAGFDSFNTRSEYSIEMLAVGRTDDDDIENEQGYVIYYASEHPITAETQFNLLPNEQEDEQ